ncbi:MAG: hypothetical protein Q9218_004755 [Villophora microphyllina]
MSKRNGDEEFNLNGFVISAELRHELLVQKKQVESVLERSKQLLSQALKLARGFERQKLGRRQKAAQLAKNDGDKKRLGAEVAALKVMDMNVTAKKHLYRSMSKSPSIVASPAFTLYLQSMLDEKHVPLDPAHANVAARLFSSQPVKKALDDCLSHICTSLGAANERSAKRRRIRKADYQKGLSGSHAEALSRSANGDIQESEAPRDLLHFPHNGQSVANSIQASDTDEDINYEDYGSRLGVSSDSVSIGGSEEIDYGGIRANIANTSPVDLSVSLSPSPSDSSVATKTSAPGDKGTSGNPAANPNSTTFLPSLSLGGYLSGSEPGTDDEGPSDNQTRKNRRGQRERRLIAEKKHGQNAAHLKKQASERHRDQGWDARKGAQPDNERGKRGRGRGGRSLVSRQSHPWKTGPASGSGANSDPLGSKKSTAKNRPTEGPLHPSWQAAKVAKEQKKAAAFQGKKVLFD